MNGYDGDFTKEFRSCQQELFRYAYYLTKNREQADDLVGNAWYKYLLNIEGIDRSRQKFWLLRVIYNDFLDSQRKKSRWRFTPLKLDEVDVSQQLLSTDDALEKKEEKEQLLAIIANLNFPYREVIFHFYFSEMSVKELQILFGMSSSQIKTILYRGRKKIKERILNE